VPNGCGGASRAQPMRSYRDNDIDCLLRVKSAVLTFGRLLPFFDKQTFSKSVGISQRCHVQTLRTQQCIDE
jgi:hypothetical protein